jgi:hypothetical protein
MATQLATMETPPSFAVRSTKSAATSQVSQWKSPPPRDW